MTTIIINQNDLKDAILEFKDNLPDILKDAIDLKELEQGNLGTLIQYFGDPSCFDTLNAACGDNCQLSYQDGNIQITIKYNENNGPADLKYLLKPIIDFSDWVARSYDNETYPWENNAWDEGYCTGTDDADYNSSYLDCIIAFIELHFLAKKLTYRDYTTYCQTF